MVQIYGNWFNELISILVRLLISRQEVNEYDNLLVTNMDSYLILGYYRISCPKTMNSAVDTFLVKIFAFNKWIDVYHVGM